MIRIEDGDGEDFQRWNQKMIQESAKMIRLILVLLIIWTFIAVGWTVHMIINSGNAAIEYTHARNLYKRHDMEDHPVFNSVKYENLSFYTTIPAGADSWEKIKTFIGTFHQLRESNGKVPKMTIYTDMKLDSLQEEEASAWNNVEITNNPVSLMPRVWIATGYAFDPVALDLRRANLLEEASEFERVFEKGRRIIEEVVNKCMELVDEETGEVVLKTHCTSDNAVGLTIINSASSWGLMKFERLTKGFSCHVDLKWESVENGADLIDFEEDFSNTINGEKVKKLAIGVPTTSKGMKSEKEKHVLLTALIPSINATLTKKEINDFRIVVFIAFDKGDLYFENDTWRKKLKLEMIKILPKEIKIVFLRLKPLRRVAMTWNMIFSYARKRVKFDYFYQVNDDLTMKTSGWLSKFASTLDGNGGFGVTGPSDSFNGFSCSLLTQSFVTWKHFEIFKGQFYPLEFRDWKSDRWLSFVYGEKGTFCDEEIEATNGAKGTRYVACAYGEWKVVLERGKKQVRDCVSVSELVSL